MATISRVFYPVSALRVEIASLLKDAGVHTTSMCVLASTLKEIGFNNVRTECCSVPVMRHCTNNCSVTFTYADEKFTIMYKPLMGMGLKYEGMFII